MRGTRHPSGTEVTGPRSAATRIRRTPRRLDRTSTRWLLSLGVAVLSLTPGATTGTLAAWSDTASVNGTTIGAARVDLKVNNADSLTSFSTLSTVQMAPSVVTAGILTVRNNGTVPLSYYVTAAATNTDGKGLASALAVRVTGAAAVTGPFPNQSCGGSVLADSAISFTTAAFLGSAASPRTLAAGTQETLCVEAGLSSTAPTSMQNATTNVSFGFTAATSPAPTGWSDSVPIGATTISTPTIATPSIACAGQNSQVSNIRINVTNATLYRVHYGSGGSLTDTTSTSPYTVSMPASGIVYMEAIYGNTTWMSGSSNTLTYGWDGSNATCS
jgi:hypothetical protein